MARIHGTNRQEKVSINKFLGVFETEDGDTDLKNGVAAQMVNWRITDSYHLQTRPGIITRRIRGVGEVLAIRSGYYKNVPWTIVVENDGVELLREDTNVWVQYYQTLWSRDFANVFEFGGNLYMADGHRYTRISFSLDADNHVKLTFTDLTNGGYIPTVVTGASPSGGGTTFERVNLLTGKRKVQYSADGTSTDYVLPETAGSVLKVIVNGTDKLDDEHGLSPGNNYNGVTFAADGKKITFGTPPTTGTNNVVVQYEIPNNTDNLNLIINQKFAEAYNGPTDTRIFLAGDGSNVMYYSGITEAGEPTAEYFPALNEIRVDATNTPIMGMARHYSRMLVFKPDSTWSISYETTYLPDGTATAGFRLVPMHREIGSDAPGQTATCKNFVRTYCRGNLYSWQQTASYYQDERYAKMISEPVRNSLRKADKDSIYLFDDDERQRFYCFLNDTDGTVVVNDYNLDVWYVWTGFFNVHCMARNASGGLIFSRHRSADTLACTICELRDTLSYDYVAHEEIVAPEDPDDEPTTVLVWERTMIPCRWESGHMSFGAQSQRKYSSYVWVTLLAGTGAVASVTARTDRRAEYAVKTDYANTTGLFDATEFDRFSFETYLAPFAKRLKLKVKKFVYYKLIITNKDPMREEQNAADPLYPIVYPTWSATPKDDGMTGSVCVLNIDMKLRRTSDAK